MNRPVLTIVAGSNGCGKTSMTILARSYFQDRPNLDPDAASRSLQETMGFHGTNMEAGKQVLRKAAELLAERQSFTIETTLSGSTYLKMALRAKDAGFRIVVIFIGTTSVEINLSRVRSRVALGGHDVPEEDQRRRYPRTLAHMQKLLPIADVAYVFDNSTDEGHVLVGAGRPSFISWFDPLPEWANSLRKVESSL